MKYIITEEQVNLIKEETYGSSKQIKFLKNYYDVDVSSKSGDKKIRTIVRFIPKDSDNEMTPSIVGSMAIWTNKGNGGLDLNVISYFKEVGRMPLLDYIGDTHYLDGYLEYLHRSEARKVVS